MKLSVFILSLAILLSCSSDKNKRAQNKNTCDVIDIYSKHAKLYAEYNLNGLKECLRNHIRLHKTAINFQTCNHIKLNKSGVVTWAKVYGKKAPTDFKWCIEQTLWKANFAALQIKESLQLKFPLSFEYK
jgi:hypothetical protein